MSDKPWTYIDFTHYREDTWTIYDPNLARIIAVFYTEREADKYLKWRNKKQARKRDEIDPDGRC